MPKLTIPEKLLPLILKKKRYKIVVGGRGSGKSQTVCDIAIADSKQQGLKIGCFREYQNSIEDSVHSLLKDEITRLGFHGFNVTNTAITNDRGGEFKFRGLARNPEAMKSMHGFQRFIVEEAQTISAHSLKLLTPTLREDDSEIWMMANPMSSADPFSQRFIIPFQKELDRNGYYEDDLHLIIVCNYMDNPFFPAVLEQERLFDKEHLSVAEYEHIWLGTFNDTVEGAIISVEWFNSTIDAHIKLGFKQVGATIVTHDPSDEGKDAKGLCARQGSVVFDVSEMTTGDAEAGMNWALYWALEYRADVFRWDCDGLGVALKSIVTTVLDGKGMDVDMFKGSESVDRPGDIYQPDTLIDKTNAKSNEQTFRNKRAQYYWELRDRIYSTFRAIKLGAYTDPSLLISFSSDIDIMDRLRSEICRIPLKYNANGMIQIMSKEDMAKLKPPISSPNLADSVMMSMKAHTRNYTHQAVARAVTVKSAGGWT